MKVRLTQQERAYIAGKGHQTLLEDDSNDSKDARSYLIKERKLNLKTIKNYKIGYVPSRYRHDWSERIIMPLYDPFGNLKVLTSRKHRAKDKNEMPHLHEEFNKKFYLYGLNVAAPYIRKKNKVIIVEGQFDTMRLHSIGLKATVGVLGSSFTPEHACLLRRYCSNIIFMFDNDTAGLKMFKKTFDIDRKFDLSENYKFCFSRVVLPKSKNDSKMDPDNFLNKHSVNDLVEQIQDAELNPTTEQGLQRMISKL